MGRKRDCGSDIYKAGMKQMNELGKKELKDDLEMERQINSWFKIGEERDMFRFRLNQQFLYYSAIQTSKPGNALPALWTATTELSR